MLFTAKFLKNRTVASSIIGGGLIFVYSGSPQLISFELLRYLYTEAIKRRGEISLHRRFDIVFIFKKFTVLSISITNELVRDI